MQIAQIAFDGLKIRIFAGEQTFHVAVGVLELTFQARNESFAHELGSLAQQIQTRAVADAQRPVDGAGGDAAQYKFRIKPIAALLEVATIGHLRDQVRRSKQVPQFLILGIGELDHIELDLVTREMHDSRGDGHPVFHADARQIARQKTRAAGDVIQREFSAIAMLAIIEFPNVAGVMEQRSDQRQAGALGAEAQAALDGTLIADQQPRHGERHVQRVLAIVIQRIDAVIPRHAARKELVEVLKSNRDLVEVFRRPRGCKKFTDGGADRCGGADLNGIRDVEIITSEVVHQREFRP